MMAIHNTIARVDKIEIQPIPEIIAPPLMKKPDIDEIR
jgi:hypothetical protein